MRILKCMAILAVIVVSGCGSGGTSNSAGETNGGSTTTTTSAKTTTTKSKASPTVPKGAPSAPREVSGAPFEAGVIHLFWKAPKSSGNAPIVAYVVRAYYGSSLQKTKAYASSVPKQSMSGLQNGYPYTFDVAATNTTGTGPFSKRSGPVTVGAPGIPQNATATKSGVGSLRVSFDTPMNNGADITSFTAACTSSNGGVKQKRKASAGPIKVTGLSGGKTYTCTVTATNSRGTGPLSPPSNAVVVSS